MKQIFYLIFIFSFIELNAQTNKNYILRTNFGYSFSHEVIPDAGTGNYGLYNYGIKNHDLKFAISAGRKLKSNFYYGLGLFYNASNEEINPDEDTPKTIGSTGYVTATGYVNSISENNTISPFLYIEYSKILTDRLFFVIDMYSNYDFTKISTKNIYYQPNITDNNYTIFSESNTETKTEYIRFGIHPSLRFDIIKNIGLEFTFGLLEYKHKIKDSRTTPSEKKTEQFEIGFEPKNWLIGFYLKL